MITKNNYKRYKKICFNLDAKPRVINDILNNIQSPIQTAVISHSHIYQARQTRPNSGGVAEGHPRFDKGGVAINF